MIGTRYQTTDDRRDGHVDERENRLPIDGEITDG